MFLAPSWLVVGSLQLLLMAESGSTLSGADGRPVAVHIVRISESREAVAGDDRRPQGEIVLQYQNPVLDRIQVFLEVKPNQRNGSGLPKDVYELTRERSSLAIPIAIGSYVINVQVGLSRFSASKVVKIEDRSRQLIRIVGKLAMMPPPASQAPNAPSKTFPHAVLPVETPSLAAHSPDHIQVRLVQSPFRSIHDGLDIAVSQAQTPSAQAAPRPMPVVLPSPQSQFAPELPGRGAMVELEIQID
jgi:hypothetical protein